MTSPSIRLRELAGAPVAIIRRHATRSELAKLVPECCGIVWQALRAQQAQGGRHVAIYWNADILLEAGAELEGPFAERDGVILSATPGGTTACATHLGPYHTLGTTHAAIRSWCEAQGYRLAGPCWEIYGHWQDDWNTNPNLIRTDVFYQIASS